MKVFDIFRKENVQVINPGNIAGRIPLVTEPAARLGARLVHQASNNKLKVRLTIMRVVIPFLRTFICCAHVH